MVLKNIHLTNFRNIAALNLELSSLTLLLGKNAQGKSNILEAIYFLATTKSPRAERDTQLIKEGEGFLRVEGEVVDQLTANSPSGLSLRVEDLQLTATSKAVSRKQDAVSKLEIVMQKHQEIEGLEKKVKVNGIPRRVTDYIGNLVVVYFSPEDINLVTGPPALRRWHIDLTLAPVDKQYKAALNTYHESLVAKNQVLKKVKEGLAKLNELDFWIGQMVESGTVIATKRREFFQSVNETAASLDGLAGLRFVYEENKISEARIKEYLSREVAASTSLIGPHRDDFIFKRESLSLGNIGQDLAYFGSRGEQRTAVLELKLAELKYIQKTISGMPVLLLDDVFSELDDLHREYVVSIITANSGSNPGFQVLLSAVEEERLPEELLQVAKIVKVEKGKIVEEPSVISSQSSDKN